MFTTVEKLYLATLGGVKVRIFSSRFTLWASEGIDSLAEKREMDCSRFLPTKIHEDSRPRVQTEENSDRVR